MRNLRTCIYNLLQENALPDDIVGSLRELLAAERNQQVAEGVVDRKGDGGAHCTGFSQANDLQTHSAVTHMLTNPRVLPKVVDILGTNISM
jgi:hypothetical protein